MFFPRSPIYGAAVIHVLNCSCDAIYKMMTTELVYIGAESFLRLTWDVGYTLFHGQWSRIVNGCTTCNQTAQSVHACTILKQFL